MTDWKRDTKKYQGICHWWAYATSMMEVAEQW
jgi:hypothetical protein